MTPRAIGWSLVLVGTLLILAGNVLFLWLETYGASK